MGGRIVDTSIDEQISILEYIQNIYILYFIYKIYVCLIILYITKNILNNKKIKMLNIYIYIIFIMHYLNIKYHYII